MLRSTASISTTEAFGRHLGTYTLVKQVTVARSPRTLPLNRVCVESVLCPCDSQNKVSSSGYKARFDSASVRVFVTSIFDKEGGGYTRWVRIRIGTCLSGVGNLVTRCTCPEGEDRRGRGSCPFLSWCYTQDLWFRRQISDATALGWSKPSSYAVLGYSIFSAPRANQAFP